MTFRTYLFASKILVAGNILGGGRQKISTLGKNETIFMLFHRILLDLLDEN